MIHDASTPLVERYRASAGDTPTPALDQAILAAARLHLVKRRRVRVAAAAFSLGAMAMLAIGWLSRGSPTGEAPITRVTEFGKWEGVSRPYLMMVEEYYDAGRGSAEGRP
jgi:ferric-dicitrate binding protein FerR (iron transport regulator)